MMSQANFFLQFKSVVNKSAELKIVKSKSNQISLFLTQLQLQQNELKLNTQNAQLKAGKKKFKVSHQINPVAEAYRETAKEP